MRERVTITTTEGGTGGGATGERRGEMALIYLSNHKLAGSQYATRENDALSLVDPRRETDRERKCNACLRCVLDRKHDLYHAN